MSIGVFKFLSSIIFTFVILKTILPARGVEQITVRELHRRPPAQYRRFHVFGFKNMPLRQLGKQVASLDKDRPVVTICQTGALGNRACKRLKRYGFKKLTNVRGGLSTWEPVHSPRRS